MVIEISSEARMVNRMEKLWDNKLFLTVVSLAGSVTLFLGVAAGFYLVTQLLYWGQNAVLFNIPI